MLFIKDPLHRGKVIKMLVSLILMGVCFRYCMKSMDLHWEIRYQFGFLVSGVLYMLTALGIATNDGISVT
jgi:cytochrome bd-type quinol oxidase subunit 2